MNISSYNNIKKINTVNEIKKAILDYKNNNIDFVIIKDPYHFNKFIEWLIIEVKKFKEDNNFEITNFVIDKISNNSSNKQVPSIFIQGRCVIYNKNTEINLFISYKMNLGIVIDEKDLYLSSKNEIRFTPSNKYLYDLMMTFKCTYPLKEIDYFDNAKILEMNTNNLDIYVSKKTSPLDIRSDPDFYIPLFNNLKQLIANKIGKLIVNIDYSTYPASRIQYPSEEWDLICNKIIFYVFHTEEKVIYNNKFNGGQGFNEYVNNIISFEITPNDELEVYINRGGINDLEVILEESFGVAHNFCQRKELDFEAYTDIGLVPYIIGSNLNKSIKWSIINCHWGY